MDINCGALDVLQDPSQNELYLGRAQKCTRMPHDLAIIVGGSVAGLCTAAALSGTFAKVVILEQDAVNATSNKHERPGTVQMSQTHVLLQGGLNAMEQLLPGFTQEMLQRGSRAFDFPGEVSHARTQTRFYATSTNPRTHTYNRCRTTLAATGSNLTRARAACCTSAVTSWMIRCAPCSHRNPTSSFGGACASKLFATALW